MNKARMREALQAMLASLDDEDPGDAVVELMRENRKIIADAFKAGVRDGEAEIRASAPERRTLDAATTLSLQQQISKHEYRHKKWEAMSPAERIAAQIEATTAPDTDKDIAASSPAEITASIAGAMHALHPGVHVSALSADTRHAPALRKRVGECTGEMQKPEQNHELVWSRD